MLYSAAYQEHAKILQNELQLAYMVIQAKSSCHVCTKPQVDHNTPGENVSGEEFMVDQVVK
jgi:hypothetical protein